MQSIAIRPAQPGDALAVAEVHVRAWQAGYRDLLPRDYLDNLRAEERAARYTFGDGAAHAPQTLVALSQERLIGFATTIVSAPDAPGELSALHVAPEHWNHGVGQALIGAARARLRAAGCRDAVLWILDGNERALRFYRADGWRDDGTRRSDVVWGVAVQERRLARAL